MDQRSTVFIGGLPEKYCTEAVVEKLLGKFGPLQRCNVHKNCGFGEFVHAPDAQTAIAKLNGRKLGGSVLLVRLANKSKPPKQATIRQQIAAITKTLESKK